MSVLRHKDYQGSVEYDEGKLHLRILHLDDLITTEIDRASEAQLGFAELVDDYLATCAAVGKQPSKPFKGSFNVRIAPTLHEAVALDAAEHGETLNSYCALALQEFLRGRGSRKEADVPFAEQAAWVGYLRLSLVTCPITMVAASRRNELGHRVSTEASGDLDIEAFVAKDEIDHSYLADPYLIAPPDNKVGHDAFVLIRETIRVIGKVGLARCEVDGREQIVTLEPHDKGLVGNLLRRSSEVSQWSSYFANVASVKITQDMLDLAKHIVDQKTVHFDPEIFEQWYRKSSRSSREASNVINLMEALKRSQKRDGLRQKAKGSTRRSSSH
jgi:non-homologous end joining protein Ku/predicted HicB family RNase H-like nuclease